MTVLIFQDSLSFAQILVKNPASRCDQHRQVEKVDFFSVNLRELFDIKLSWFTRCFQFSPKYKHLNGKLSSLFDERQYRFFD
jgi:hypothetical protein